MGAFPRCEAYSAVIHPSVTLSIRNPWLEVKIEVILQKTIISAVPWYCHRSLLLHNYDL